MEAINLFADYDLLPEEPKKLLEQFEEATQGEPDYDDLREWHEKFNAIGYTFDWGLDAVPYALTSINFFDKLKNLHESGDLAIPLYQSDDDDAESNTFVSIIQGYYTFKTGERVDITIDHLLGK